MQLNGAQQRAVDHEEGPMLVLAGPGSGKTAVITMRTLRLIEKCSVPPEKILVITFSRAAALGMKSRFQTISDNNYNSVNFGTFHAIFFKILKSVYSYDKSNILTDEDRYRIIKDAVLINKIKTENETELVQKLSKAIAELKGNAMAPEDTAVRIISAEEFGAVYNYYEKRLKEEQKIDFEDMMLKTTELFKKEPELLKSWQERYSHILIDEFQDINRLQYELVKMLGAPQNNIFAVGDDDQSIYGFRGAGPELMFEFERDYKNVKRVLLDVNYRCAPEILKAAVSLIDHNRKRFRKKLNSAGEKSGICEYRIFGSLEEENRFITNSICRLREERGEQKADIAVLYRMNHEVRSLLNMLEAEGIPCRIHEHMSSVFEHRLCAELIAYMKLAGGDTARENWLKIINRPKRYVTRESLETETVSIDALIAVNTARPYVTERLRKLKYDLNVLAGLDPFASIKYIRRAIGYDDCIREYSAAKGSPADELLEILDELEESAHGFNSLGEWLEAVERFKKEARAGEKVSDWDCGSEEKKPVELMTFHSAKGLEFDTVFIPDLLEGFVPQKRAETEAELEEERRCLYVAMTRARDRLYLLGSRERLGRPMQESRFARETGLKSQKTS